MNISHRITFEFYGEIMECFLMDDGKFLLPIYEMCGIMGLSYNSALIKHIKRDPVLANGFFYVRTMRVRADNSLLVGPVACLQVNFLPYWLGYLDTDKLKPKLRKKVTRFKFEMAELLWSAYRDHILPPDILAKINIMPKA